MYGGVVVCVGVVITPESGNRRWFKSMQGAQLDGVNIGLCILVYLDVMIGFVLWYCGRKKRVWYDVVEYERMIGS